LKNLTLRPGKSVNDYIDGRRKNIFNPISYALLAITAYLLIGEYVGHNEVLKEENFKDISNLESYKWGKEIGKFVANYIKFFFLLHIVYLSLVERLFFTKRNFYEIMTMNAFIVGHSIVIGILFFPLLRLPIITDPIIYTSILVLSFFVFKKNYGKTEAIFIPFFSLMVSLILMFLVPMLVIYVVSLLK